jgi:hypothetical protein
MSRVRWFLTFFLAFVLISSLAMAAPHHAANPPKAPAVSATAEMLFSHLWGWITGVWTKEGCGIDPSGQCKPGSGTTVAPPGDSVDAGCIIDPGGSCSAGK